MFYEGLKGLHEPFEAPQVNFILIQFSEMHGTGRLKIELKS